MFTQKKKIYPFNFRVKLKTKILDAISTAYKDHHSSVIHNLALKHKEVSQTVPAFLYKKRYYMHPQFQGEMWDIKPLHSSLHETMNTYLTNWQQFQDRQHIADNALTAALNTMGTTKDLFLLLPTAVHQFITPADDEEVTLSDEAIQRFNVTYENELKAIAVQLVISSIH